MKEDFKKSLVSDFDFEAFQKEAIEKLKAGKPLSGKDGVMMPLIKRIVEAALKGEVASHLDSEPAAGGDIPICVDGRHSLQSARRRKDRAQGRLYDTGSEHPWD